jgi:hypothetical protein
MIVVPTFQRSNSSDFEFQQEVVVYITILPYVTVEDILVNVNSSMSIIETLKHSLENESFSIFSF